jgi:hypothetical protein
MQDGAGQNFERPGTQFAVEPFRTKPLFLVARSAARIVAGVQVEVARSEITEATP